MKLEYSRSRSPYGRLFSANEVALLGPLPVVRRDCWCITRRICFYFTGSLPWFSRGHLLLLVPRPTTSLFTFTAERGAALLISRACDSEEATPVLQQIFMHNRVASTNAHTCTRSEPNRAGRPRSSSCFRYTQESKAKQTANVSVLCRRVERPQNTSCNYII